jgi:hypothetical protein
VTICKVLRRLHILFIEAPRATAMKALATTPPVREVSTSVKAFSTALIRATNFYEYLEYLLLLGF